MSLVKFPAWWCKPKPVRRVSEQKERVLASELGARLHSNSGAGKEKHDMSTSQLLIEHKYTKFKSYPINCNYWRMLEKRARSTLLEPVLVVEFTPDGLSNEVSGYNKKLVVITLDFLKELVGNEYFDKEK